MTVGRQFGSRTITQVLQEGSRTRQTIVSWSCECGERGWSSLSDMHHMPKCKTCSPPRPRRKPQGPTAAELHSEGVELTGLHVVWRAESWTVRGMYAGRLDLEQPSRVDADGNTMPARTALHVPMEQVEVVRQRRAG